MTPQLTATRIGPPGARAAVFSRTPTVTDWVERHFSPWWYATGVDPKAQPFPHITADVDPAGYAEIANAVHTACSVETTYAKARTLYTTDGNGTVLAVSPGDGIAYRSAGDSITVAGLDEQIVCLAAARIGREAVRGLLTRDGYTLLHASAAVTPDGRALLTFGAKGTGKTTTALLLARHHDLGLLAHDRMFARADPDGTVRLLPWVAAATVGLGLLDALGLYDIVREHLLDGERLHPTQDQRVTDALHNGHREPLYDADGHRELEVQLFPDQLHDWFGLDLVTHATAAALLFPRIEPAGTPSLISTACSVGDDDVFTAKTEDRYRDLLCLRPRFPAETWVDQKRLRDALVRLPHHGAVLTHDTLATADTLAKITASL